LTKKKNYKWISDDKGNLITKRGRFALKQTDPLNGFPAHSEIDISKPRPHVPDLQKHIPDSSLNFFEKIKAKLYHLKVEGETKMWNTIKNFLVAKLVQWILKVGAGVLGTLGISNGSLEEIIGAIVSLVLGIVYSLLTHKKLALTDPKVFLN